MAISATHGRGIPGLIEAISQRLAGAADKPAEPVMRLAVVGKRNAGKSAFVNALAGEQRVIVSETPGTTRDSVDVTIEIDGRTFMVIDTAGFRKQRQVAGIEFYGYHRAMRAIRRADVVALMIDASVPVSQVDKDLAGEIARQFKPVVLVVNKWDLARGSAAGEDYAEYFGKTFPEFSFAPISLTVSTDGTNVTETIRLAEQLFRQANTRVGTGELNRAVHEVLAVRGPSHKTGTRPPNILYVSQIATAPPTIVCFVNDVRSFDAGYQRFLLNHLRRHLPFPEVPIRLLLRQRRTKK
jgi:GTP-binding protein